MSDNEVRLVFVCPQDEKFNWRNKIRTFCESVKYICMKFFIKANDKRYVRFLE